MAQFARTFTIYGGMAIVIERTARIATPHPIVRHIVIAVHHAAPIVVVRPTATPVAWMPHRQGFTSNAFDAADSAGDRGPRVSVSSAARQLHPHRARASVHR